MDAATGGPRGNLQDAVDQICRVLGAPEGRLPTALVGAIVTALQGYVDTLRGIVVESEGTSRSEVVLGVQAADGVWPVTITEDGDTEVLGLTLRLEALRETQYLPRGVLMPWVIKVYEVGADGNDSILAAYMPSWITEDGGFDFIAPGPLSNMFSNGAVAAPNLHYALKDETRYVWGAVRGSLTAIAVPPDGSNALDMPVGFGQSNAENGGLSSLDIEDRLETSGVVDRHRALMLDTGLLGTGGTVLDAGTLLDFKPAKESDVAGESGGASFMRYAITQDDAIGLYGGAYAYRTCGQSGQSITVLKSGGTPYANLLDTVQRSAELASLYGLNLRVPVVLWRHGEADADAMNQATYLGHLNDLHETLVRDVQEITRQPTPVWLLVNVLVAPDGTARGITPVTLAQVEAITQGVTIAASCAPYWFHGTFGFNTGQSVHWKPLAKAHLVEFEARAARIISEAMAQAPGARLGDLIWRRVFDGTDWQLEEVPFETSPRIGSAERTAAVIDVTVPYAEGGLSLYTAERGAATDSGFVWTPDSGVSAIDTVEIFDAGPINAIVRITLTDDDSGGTLTYAVAEQDATADDGPDCWGDVFDDCQEESLAIPGQSLRQGLLPFSVIVA